jgi:lipoate-protein ligase A
MLDALAEGAGPAAAWTAVTRPALVLGRAASDPPLDETLAAREEIVIRRRGSGGGAVLWDADLLALDVALPAGHALADRDVVRAYRWLGAALADAMRDLGAEDVHLVLPEEARAAREASRATAAACFGALSSYEVTAAGRKLVGVSQIRRRHGMLLQAGIPLAFDASRLARLLLLDRAAADALAAGTVGLAELVPGVTMGDVVTAVERRVSAHGIGEASRTDPRETPCA